MSAHKLSTLFPRPKFCSVANSKLKYLAWFVRLDFLFDKDVLMAICEIEIFTFLRRFGQFETPIFGVSMERPSPPLCAWYSSSLFLLCPSVWSFGKSLWEYLTYIFIFIYIFFRFLGNYPYKFEISGPMDKTGRGKIPCISDSAHFIHKKLRPSELSSI